MESFLPILFAALIAGFLTFCDLDTLFDAPPPGLSWGPSCKLKFWWWGFVIVNAIIAGFVCFGLNESSYFKETNPWLKAFAAGASYSALVRLKFTTLKINGQETPIGIEAFYEGLKNLIHKRINRIIREWRMEQSARLAQSDVATLERRSKLHVIADVLMSDEERKLTTTWIDQIVKGDGIQDEDRRLHLAIFIITGQRRPPP